MKTSLNSTSTYQLKSFFVLWWWCFSHQVVSSSCTTVDRSLPGSSVRGVSLTRVLEWVAIPFSRGSSGPRHWPGFPELHMESYWLSYQEILFKLYSAAKIFERYTYGFDIFSFHIFKAHFNLFSSCHIFKNYHGRIINSFYVAKWLMLFKFFFLIWKRFQNL